VLAGALGVAIALVAAGVVSALSIFYTIMGVSLFVPILAGLFNGRAASMDALAAIVAGITVVGGWRVLYAGKAMAGITPAMGGLTAAIVTFFVVQTLRRALGGSDGPTKRTLLPLTEQ
jgi:SSS family solute:Na+ symporter